VGLVTDPGQDPVSCSGWLGSGPGGWSEQDPSSLRGGEMPNKIGITWGLLYWPYWMILTGLTFLVPEISALCTNYRNTLSDYSRYELSVGTSFGHGVHTVAWYVSLIGWLLFVVVITLHIWWVKNFV
jgi:hypothetical protein